MARGYWLLKTEPESFGWDDLWRAPKRTRFWDGVRNYQARNFMRDAMKVGDGVFLYHSNADPPAVMGTARVATAAAVDPTQFDPADHHYDPASTPENPRWLGVEITADRALPRPVPLPVLRETRGLEEMILLRRGNRLSVMPVTAAEWRVILRLGGVK